MRTPSPSPNGTHGRLHEIPVEIKLPSDLRPETIWRELVSDNTEPWLAEIGELRVDDDDLERSLDIWSVMLIAALRQPERRDTAAAVLARLRKMSDVIEAE